MNPDASGPQPLHGELGVLRDDGEKAQCHLCGEWFGQLGGHAPHAHGPPPTSTDAGSG